MSQFNPPPIGDILKNAESGKFFDLNTVSCADLLPTQDGILAEPQSKPDKHQDNEANLPEDEANPNPSQTEPSVGANNVSDKENGDDAEGDVPASTFSDSEKTLPISPPSAVSSEDFAAIQKKIDSVELNVKVLADSSAKMAGEIREMHKLYHNEYASRLKSMQDELEQYREMDKGRIFDGILGEVAKLYTDYESVTDAIIDEKIKKRICYMLEDIVQILEANGVKKQKSVVDAKRNTRHCQVVERIPTNDKEQHDTVAKSHGSGFYIDNRTLIKEPVDIYFYGFNTESKLD